MICQSNTRSSAVTWNIWHLKIQWEAPARMSAMVQALTGLQQNPFSKPELCSFDQLAGSQTIRGSIKKILLTVQVSACFFCASLSRECTSP